MSTRGLMGFQKGGKIKAAYNHFDSYFEGLGKKVIEEINKVKVEDRVLLFNGIFNDIVLVGEHDKPTKEQIDYCLAFPELIQADRQEIENWNWYTILQPLQGKLEVYINGFKYMENDANFLQDKTFCEYAYIINLDTNCLDIYYWTQEAPTMSINLLQEIDYEKELKRFLRLKNPLPKSVTINLDAIKEFNQDDLPENFSDAICDFLSDRYGFCVENYSMTLVAEINNIEWDMTE